MSEIKQSGKMLATIGVCWCRISADIGRHILQGQFQYTIYVSIRLVIKSTHVSHLLLLTGDCQTNELLMLHSLPHTGDMYLLANSRTPFSLLHVCLVLECGEIMSNCVTCLHEMCRCHLLHFSMEIMKFIRSRGEVFCLPTKWERTQVHMGIFNNFSTLV